MKKRLLLPFLLVIFSFPLQAQNTDLQPFGEDVQRFSSDMLVIARHFAQPAADGAAYQAGAGWFSSAKALEKWDFRLSFHGNALFVPSDKETFILENDQLQLIEMENNASAELPTAFGATTDVYFTGDITYNDPFRGEEVIQFRFKGLDGINKAFVLHAFAQVAVGLPAQTELTLRAMPEVTIDGVSASTYGAGVKHNLNQYFGYSYPEDFQVALGIAYSKFNVNYDYEPIEVEGLVMMNRVDVNADLFMAEVIGSKMWSGFEVFGALGVMNSAFDYEMGGSGPGLLIVNGELGKLGDAKFQFKGDVGFNVHFDRFRLSTMMTIGEFVNANVGLGVKI